MPSSSSTYPILVGSTLSCLFLRMASVSTPASYLSFLNASSSIFPDELKSKSRVFFGFCLLASHRFFQSSPLSRRARSGFCVMGTMSLKKLSTRYSLPIALATNLSLASNSVALAHSPGAFWRHFVTKLQNSGLQLFLLSSGGLLFRMASMI